ncbi:MAG TPA: hypothetical protein VFU43_25220 [Streptosporangiaceae bacterium]|nr:hypothetical protein [Streptosporangiaceae bacterium]
MAGVALAMPLLGAATPYVRLEGEQGTTADEKDRFTREVEAINFHLLMQPAIQTQPALLALWANLDQFHRSARVDVYALKAKTAILAGANAITLTDPTSGRRWFQLAHSYARLGDAPSLIELAHARAANAELYWDSKGTKEANINAALAARRASSTQMEGMAQGMLARIAGRQGRAQAALRHAEQAVAFATDAGESPRLDLWSAPIAHGTAACALATFPELAQQAERHAQASLQGYPAEATHRRTQARFDIARVRINAEQLDGAADTIMTAIRQLPVEHLEPNLMAEVHELYDLAEQRHPRTRAMRPVREWLEALPN